MTDFFGALPSFSCHVASSLDLTSKGTNSHIVTKMSVRLARPNRLALVVDDGTMGVTVVSDGRQLVQYLPALKRSVVSAAPPGFRGMTYTGAPNSITMLGTTDSVIPLSGPEFYRNLMASATKADYLGQEKVGDAECHHCRCTQEDFDWDIWIDSGKQPLVRKVALDLAKYTKAGPQMPDTKIDYAVTFSDWNVAPNFAPADFAFVPPAGARRVAELIEAPTEPVNALLGQVAPPISGVDVNGNPVELKSYLGKNVVLLVFWTTWGTNCAKTLSEEDAIATHYADKGVKFLPINLGEKPADVKAFLEKNRLAAPVLLDEQSEVAGLYRVQPIPHTVLIGGSCRSSGPRRTRRHSLQIGRLRRRAPGISPGSEWLYVKLFTGTATADKVLPRVARAVASSLAVGGADQSFSVRYAETPTGTSDSGCTGHRTGCSRGQLPAAPSSGPAAQISPASSGA